MTTINNLKPKFTIFLVTSLFSFSIMAGTIKTDNPDRKRSNSQAFSEQVYKKFEKLQKLITDEMYVEARAGLTDLLARRLNRFERANVNQYLGWIDSGEGKYVAAAEKFQLALDSDALPNQAHFGMMLQLSQMHVASKQFQKAIDVLHNYYGLVDEIQDKTFAFEANAYVQIKQYNKALPVLKKAISLSDQPNEKWNSLLYLIHMALSQKSEADKVLQELIKINPSKKEYWEGVDLSKDVDIIPIVTIAPNYPRKAAIAKIEGWVEIGFTITEGGTVINPKVIGSKPERIFDREALRAILKYKFKPKVVDGVHMTQETTQIIEFRLAGE